MKFEKQRDGDILLTVKSEKSRHLQELIENQRDKHHKVHNIILFLKN